jgi:hypothetical protein
MQRLASIAALVAVAAVACSSGKPPAASCCPRDETMSGCMRLGGVNAIGCFVTCDFYCSTNWRVEVDEFGCERWSYDLRKPAPGENMECFRLPDAGDAAPGGGRD